jgi:RND superfamily putative drug exporter
MWLLAVVLALPFTVRQANHLSSGGYTAPGSQSTNVDHIVARYFPEISQTNLAVLFWPKRGAAAATTEADIRSVDRGLKAVPAVWLPHRSREAALFSAELGPVIMPLQTNLNEDNTQRAVESLQTRLGIDRPTHGNVSMHFLGESALWAALDATSKRELTSAEKIGIPILLIVLLAIFGSVAAALLPLTLGMVAVIVTGALIYFLSLTMQLSVFVTNTASMLGIGVAVDYSLIVLARLREELGRGQNLAEARRIALATSGRAVVISGLTVVASLLGVLLVPIQAVRSMALGAILVVAVSVLVTMTLLPALITALGERRLRRRSRLPNGLAPLPMRVDWSRWARRIMRRPKLSLALAVSPLLLLCVPVASLVTSTGALRQLDESNETRIAFTEASKVSSSGALGPASVTFANTRRISRGKLGRQVDALRELAGQYRGVREVSLAKVSSDDSHAFFSVTPSSDPESRGAKSLVGTLRSRLSRPAKRAGLALEVGGTSASQVDENRAVATSMWKVLALIMVLSLLVLLVLLRSVVLPLKAVLANLLSVGAAYGVLVIVFQWGWLDPVLGYHSLGHLDILTPPLILAIVFGLSMDYEVFLLSRIRERWRVHGDSRRAVAEGLARSARTITSAAFILVCVFAVFIGTGMPAIKELGLGAAVAIGLDATLVRLVIVPAAMELLGDWSWWFPTRLSRSLNALSINPPESAVVPPATAAADAVRTAGTSTPTSR